NGVSERRNRTLLNMVRSMMSLATLSLSFWDYALEYAAHILNMVPTKKVDKTPYELWHGKESGRIIKLEDEDILPSENTSEHPIEEESLALIVSEEEDVIPVHRYVRTHKATDRLCLNVENDPDRLCFNVEVEEYSLWDLNEPANYKASLSDPEFEKKGIMERFGWRLLLGVSSLPSLFALLFYKKIPESPRFLYAKGELAKASKILEGGAELNKRPLPGGGLIYAHTDESTYNVQPSINTPSALPMIGEVSQVNESKESTFGTEKADGKGTSGDGAQNEHEVVTSEEDEIKDVTLDMDKTVAGVIQIDEEHHTFKKDDPVNRARPKVEQGNPENEKEDETNENTKLITRHNNTHKFLDITSMGEVSRVNESKESTSGTEKADGKGTSGDGAQNEREVVTSEEDEIKDVTLDVDKTVASEIQIDEEHHTLKKDDPVDRAGPKVEQGNPENEKEDETNENTKLITRHNNTHKFLNITSMAEAIQMSLTGIDNYIYSTVDACPNACEIWKAIKRLKLGESINVQDLETNLYWEFGKFTSGMVNHLNRITQGSFAVMQIYSEEIYPKQLRTLGVGVAIVVGRVKSIVLPWVGEGMISDDGNKTPAMVMFSFKISVCMEKRRLFLESKSIEIDQDTFLVYGGDPEAELRVNCYCDAGFEIDRDDTKSQTG
nr:truncated transporter-related protein [Tanacetum cinerariifolium]